MAGQADWYGARDDRESLSAAWDRGPLAIQMAGYPATAPAHRGEMMDSQRAR